jgi:hypothetical protein
VKEPLNAVPEYGADAEGDSAMTIKITPNDHRNPAGKLADAEIHLPTARSKG